MIRSVEIKECREVLPSSHTTLSIKRPWGPDVPLWVDFDAESLVRELFEAF